MDNMDTSNQPTEPYVPSVPSAENISSAGDTLPDNERTQPVYPMASPVPGQPASTSAHFAEETQPMSQTPFTHSSQPTLTPGIGSPMAAPKTVARRKFMGKSLAGVAVAGGAVVVGGVALGEWLSHRGDNSGSQSQVASNLQIGHLLRRAGFGANTSDVSIYSSLGYQGAVERLLNYQQVDDSAMEQRLQALNLSMASPEDQQRWWLLRMAWSQRPLLEKMTLFWHGVLTSSYRKVGGPKVYQRMIIQNNFLRTHAFDTFDNLLLGITADPAMLFYLDLTTSTPEHPNENYARELMELFTVGLANYTQQDVFSGAAALTGWHARGLTSSYNPNNHSTLPVHYMGQTGSFDYKDIMRILADHPATPWYIGRRLFAFFAYENPSTSDLQPLVNAYVQSGHNMGAVMRALLLSPQFLSAQAYRSRIKSPVEFTVGAYRALDILGDGLGLPTLPTPLGQTLLDPPDVSGWPGDKVSMNWLNSGGWMTRLNYIDLLLVRGTASTKGKSPIDLQGMVNAQKLASPEDFVDHFASFLLDGPLPAERRSQVLNYFTASGNASAQSIVLTSGKSYPLNRVRGALYLLMTSPEYQLN